jgi:hypothetical protein
MEEGGLAWRRWTARGRRGAEEKTEVVGVRWNRCRAAGDTGDGCRGVPTLLEERSQRRRSGAGGSQAVLAGPGGEDGGGRRC